MDDSIDQYLKMHREIERMRDPLGLERLSMREIEHMHDRLGLERLSMREIERMHDPSGLGPWSQRELEQRELERSRDVLGLRQIDDLLGRRDSTFSFAERYARSSAFASPRALDLASTIGDLASGATTIAGLRLDELEKSLLGNSSNSLAKMIESTSSLDRALANVAPLAHASWLKDLEWSVAPWLLAHDALWPRDSLVLRMLERDNAFGVASWLAEPVAPTEPPRFELGALTTQPGDGGRIDIEHEVCCALCGESIFTPSSEARWIGPRRLGIRTEVVPICLQCTQRNARDPDYLRNALLAFADEPPAAAQIRFEVYDGEETDPVPCGRLTLVRDEPDPEPPTAK